MIMTSLALKRSDFVLILSPSTADSKLVICPQPCFQAVESIFLSLCSRNVAKMGKTRATQNFYFHN